MAVSDKNRLGFLEQPESRRLEFKEAFPKGDQVAQTAVAFANGAGGQIVFGVKDDPREIVGISDNRIFSLEERISNCIFDLCTPPILPEIYRKDRWEYPLEAIREALINAIIHRDYAILGSDIKVAIYDDMLEITSPGPLPDAIPVEELGTDRSEIRNRVLAPIFKDLKLIEAWGSGIQKIRKEVEQYPEIELILQEVGNAFQVQFLKKGLSRAESGQSQNQPGIKLAPSRDQVGTKQGLSRDQVGIK
jgi:predicted HTH transcriptional regulator